MSLYPSLEDMHADHMIKAQQEAFSAAAQHQQENLPYPIPNPSAPQQVPYGQPMYPDLYNYMGLELTPEIIRINMPQYTEEGALATLQAREMALVNPPTAISNLIAPLSGQSAGLIRAQVTHGIRQLILCKDAKGKVGLRAKALNTGIFVCLVQKDSPAAQCGLRFGDQILQIDGETLTGYTMEKVHTIFKKHSPNGINLAVRDRPFERTLTLHKDSLGHIGFHFKEGKICNIVKDSSAARNGLLTDHNLLEVNGQNVVGIKDKETTKIIDEGGSVITITIMPTFVYAHMIKSMAVDLLKKSMDHSVPDL